jgi:hypothetical protein
MCSKNVFNFADSNKTAGKYEVLLPDYLRFLIVRTVNLQQAAEKL